MSSDITAVVRACLVAGFVLVLAMAIQIRCSPAANGEIRIETRELAMLHDLVAL
jgi:hypothetical protein